MGFWNTLLKYGGKAAKGAGHAAVATGRSAGQAVLHPSQTLRGAGQAMKTAAVGGAAGYVAWEKLTTDKSVASIVAGLFVRNPLLKMLLIGLGGANLLNKAGHEALERKRSEGLTAGKRETEYKRYPNEPLNPRIVNPMMQGCTLVATIDHIPCTVQLSPTVADAYKAGALPLNTLANAVLAQSDRMNALASQNYDDSRQETVMRTRGIQ